MFNTGLKQVEYRSKTGPISVSCCSVTFVFVPHTCTVCVYDMIRYTLVLPCVLCVCVCDRASGSNQPLHPTSLQNTYITKRITPITTQESNIYLTCMT